MGNSDMGSVPLNKIEQLGYRRKLVPSYARFIEEIAQDQYLARIEGVAQRYASGAGEFRCDEAPARV